MTITNAPTPPTTADPSSFAARADAFIAWMAILATELNDTVIPSLNFPGLMSTSTTSVAIGTGSKSLTIETGKTFVVGMGVMVQYGADPTNWMYGTVTSYNSSTGALVLNVTSVMGSGTYASWTVTLASPLISALGFSMSGGINEARGSVAMHATAMGLWTQPNIIDGTGSAVTLTDIADAPQAGARRLLYPVAGTVVTNNATLAVNGNANYTTAAGDALLIEAITTSTFKVYILPNALPLSKAGFSMTGGINEGRGSVAMHATTMGLWAQPNVIDGTGSAVTLTAIGNAPQAGARRTLYPIAGTTITHGATFSVDGNSNYTTAAGDALVFEAVTVSTFNVNVVKNDGTPVSFQDIPTVGATVASNALTISANPRPLTFRSATLGSGAVTTINAAPVDLVVPSGATLGTVNAVQSRLAVLELLYAGAAELAVTNLAGGINLDETTLISTTTISSAADSANVIYSTTGRTSVPFRVVGFIDSTQATAGTWATAPSQIQGAGGQALMGLSGIGYGQTWQSVSRTSGTTYYNTTGKPIIVALVGGDNAGQPSNVTFIVNGVTYLSDCSQGGAATVGTFSFFVSPGSNYSWTWNAAARQQAYELR